MINLSKVRQLIEKEDEGPTLDYKEDLILETDGDKAQFVKDVLSLANSGQLAHIIIGVEDGTRKLLGIKTLHKAEQLNDILKNRCDPPLTVEYTERIILGHKVGVAEFLGDNPPHIVSVADQFGGTLSTNPQKSFFIQRGTVFIRNFNKNDGASRADLDKMNKVKYVTLEADLKLSHELSMKPLDDSKEVDITFFLENIGEVIATDIHLCIQSKNIREIVRCTVPWRDISFANENIPTVQALVPVPLVGHLDKIVQGLS